MYHCIPLYLHSCRVFRSLLLLLIENVKMRSTLCNYIAWYIFRSPYQLPGQPPPYTAIESCKYQKLHRTAKPATNSNTYYTHAIKITGIFSHPRVKGLTGNAGPKTECDESTDMHWGWWMYTLTTAYSVDSLHVRSRKLLDYNYVSSMAWTPKFEQIGIMGVRRIAIRCDWVINREPSLYCMLLTLG